MMMPPSDAGTKTRKTGENVPLVPQGYLVPFVLVTTLFFLWAIPNNLNDVLIRQFMKSFVMNRLGAGLVQFAFYLGYFFLAMPAALIMRKLGYKSGFLIGLGLYSVGTILFWPAAVVDRYGFFLAALFVIASGLSFLETASNPFIAQLGDPRSATRRLNFSQAFNPVGSVVGVWIGTKFIFSGIDLTPAQVAAQKAQHHYRAYLHSETLRVVKPYLVVSMVTLTMLVLIAVTKFPKMQAEDEGVTSGGFRTLLRYPHFLFAVVAQFLYVGAQVGTWSYLIPYIIMYTHEAEKAAGYLLTGSLVAFGVGRFLSAWLMRYVRPNRLMLVFCVVNTLLATVGVLAPNWLGAGALLLTSLFMSLMYPTIFAQGIRGLGENTKIGGSLIVMAIVGGAVMPLAMGFLSDRYGLAVAYAVPLVAYLVLIFYSLTDMRLADSVSVEALEAH
jgi:MFS transporter, FHS family, L-fucose permease